MTLYLYMGLIVSTLALLAFATDYIPKRLCRGLRNMSAKLMYKHLIFVAIAILSLGCSTGTQIEVNEMTKAHTPAHHQADGSFRNPPGSPRGSASIGDMVKFLTTQLFATRTPEIPDDHVLNKAERSAQLAAADNPSVTWLGHAAFIIRIGGKVILTDPFLDKTAGPWGLGPKRFVASALQVDELPKADIMLVSHNHYDHLDAKTIEAYGYKEDTQVIVPLGLGSFFTKRGYKQVLEQDWWDEWSTTALTVTTLPAVHFSGRGIGDRNKTLWASFAITTDQGKVWFSGDTARGDIFKEIGRRAGPFDFALVGIGAYEPRNIMEEAHATPEEAIEIVSAVDAKKAIGMHWGTIMLTPENPFKAPVRFRQAAVEQGYGAEKAWILKIGETRSLFETEK